MHTTTLYRRWGDFEGLLVDAVDLAGDDGWPPPDTATYEGDLRALAHEVTEAFSDPASPGDHQHAWPVRECPWPRAFTRVDVRSVIK